ncbi:MAG: hypothetical protein ACKOE2_05520 [Actinomycetales bacterium]
MQILIHADSNIALSKDLAANIEGEFEGALDRFSGQVMRIDVHLRDINGTHLEVNDKECTLHIRIARRPPIAVSDRAPSSILAVQGAVAKAARLLDATRDRQGSHPGAPTIRTMRADRPLA